jgi:hypothetical protein
MGKDTNWNETNREGHDFNRAANAAPDVGFNRWGNSVAEGNPFHTS